MSHDPLAWLGVGSAASSEDTQETVSGPPGVEPGAWVSPVRRILEERADRNRHPDGCGCPRCEPTTHGSYEAHPEVTAQVAALAPLLPDQNPANEVPLEMLAVSLTRVRRAMRRLAEADENGELEDCLRLSKDARGWLGHAERLAERLALTPSARSALGLQEAQASAAWVGASLDLAKLPQDDLRTLERILESARVPGR
jgi:hypothetical protein